MTQLNTEQTWNQVISALGDVLTYSAIESWIKPLNPVSFDKKTFTVATANKLSKEWVIKNYSNQISKVLKEVTGKKCSFEIVVDKQIKLIQPEEYNRAEEEIDVQKPKAQAPAKNNESCIPLNEFQINALKSTSYKLNLRYNFENFIIGENNRFAREAGLAVARKPAQNHNPLFIYGGAGLGKTHLMHAIGHYILVHHPHLKIKYTSTEMFTNDLINCLIRSGGGGKMSTFRQNYRHVDVLLLDDIQFIEGKDSTQDEIFHTFDDLYNMGKQIIITSDRPPKDIPTLTDRLRSRFEWGLLADIKPPSLETRMAILKNKIIQEEIQVKNDVIELIASAYQSNIRELEGALNRVIAYSSISGEEIEIESVKRIIGFSGKDKTLNIEKIIEYTAEYFQIEPSEIKGQSRSKEISLARQIAIYLSREMTHASYPQIGDGFGGRKHTTILYAYEKMKEEVGVNRKTENAINEITKNINREFVI